MIIKKADNIYSEIEFYPVKKDGEKYYVELHSNIANGFPSPAEDFAGKRISLDEKFLSKPEATFIGKAKGMSNYPYIMPGDYLVIRSDLEAKDGDLAIVYLAGEGFSAKKIDLQKNCLTPLNKEFPEIPIGTDDVVETRGVVKTIFRDISSLNF